MDIDLLFARVNYQNFLGFHVNIRLLNVCVVSVFELPFYRYFWRAQLILAKLRCLLKFRLVVIIFNSVV